MLHLLILCHILHLKGLHLYGLCENGFSQLSNLLSLINEKGFEAFWVASGNRNNYNFPHSFLSSCPPTCQGLWNWRKLHGGIKEGDKPSDAPSSLLKPLMMEEKWIFLVSRGRINFLFPNGDVVNFFICRITLFEK